MIFVVQKKGFAGTTFDQASTMKFYSVLMEFIPKVLVYKQC